MHGKTRAISHTYTPIKTEHSSKNAVKHGYNEYGKNEFADRGVRLIKLLHVTHARKTSNNVSKVYVYMALRNECVFLFSIIWS